jgi:hypothetical protein
LLDIVIVLFWTALIVPLAVISDHYRTCAFDGGGYGPRPRGTRFVPCGQVLRARRPHLPIDHPPTHSIPYYIRSAGRLTATQYGATAGDPAA